MDRIQCKLFSRTFPADVTLPAVIDGLQSLNDEANAFLQSIEAGHFHWMSLSFGVVQKAATVCTLSIDYVKEFPDP